MTDDFSLAHWFYTNAPAAWTSAAIASGTLIYVLWSRKRPTRIIVRQLTAASLVRVWHGVKTRITVFYDDSPIEAIGRTELVIFNGGSDVAKEVELLFVFPRNTVPLSVQLHPPTASVVHEIFENRLKLTLPFLNSHREHKHEVTVAILVDGAADLASVEGHGEGWSVLYQPLPTRKQIAKNHRRILIGMSIYFVASYVYAIYLETYWGIPMSEFSLRALAAASPSLVVMVLMLRYLLRQNRLVWARLMPK